MTVRRKVEEFVAAMERRFSVSLDFDEAHALRMAAVRLHRWHEEECGDSNESQSWCIVRDDNGKTFREVYPHATGTMRRIPVRDMETNALERIAAICKRNGLVYYVQTDPRGWSLYVAPAQDMVGLDLEQVYSSRMVGVPL